MANTWSPAARGWCASPLTASARPPVRAKGKYSAAMWTTDTDVPLAVMSGGAADSSAVTMGPASGRWRVVSGRLAGDGRSVVLLHVVLHHAPRGEPGARETQRVSHLFYPAQRDARRVPGVVERNDLVFQQPVEPVPIGGIGVLA